MDLQDYRSSRDVELVITLDLLLLLGSAADTELSVEQWQLVLDSQKHQILAGSSALVSCG